MRKFKTLTLFATAALGISMVFCGHNQALASSIKVVGKNGPISSEVAPYLKKGTVLVPINIIGNFGLSNLNMSWDNTRKQVRISYRKVMITVKVNEKYGIIGDERIPLAQPAQMKHGRVMVPVRFVGEALGEPVAWDAKTQTVPLGVQR
ncbi:copper amine oxidase N-terminal domain-containing protein [Paenibacillus sp. S28]|uniref:copper amine oxidase N-terminal domain-containing protein n=1 Tax=Paenibacillus sp. S28 TaxID=2767463 RepID=UPI00190B407D|nr:copper amine oxidase N-terminal domain-containing protein [Paenibacillus sp. S28]MBJ9989435.1 copper amine oxidase N-terminal domain-containing protein [Paenibacillus sp. S28]